MGGGGVGQGNRIFRDSVGGYGPAPISLWLRRRRDR